jgi:hypothetical protein
MPCSLLLGLLKLLPNAVKVKVLLGRLRKEQSLKDGKPRNGKIQNLENLVVPVVLMNTAGLQKECQARHQRLNMN